MFQVHCGGTLTAVSIYLGMGLCIGRIGPLRERMGFGDGMIFICDIRGFWG